MLSYKALATQFCTFQKTFQKERETCNQYFMIIFPTGGNSNQNFQKKFYEKEKYKKKTMEQSSRRKDANRK
jgi:hypothetical protein